ncbi:MAG TPA: hypothetical protein VG965_05235 [Patescibacteria group bacterium]|nr:hypothetical protein [Patescibacteria group bacterium]
MKKFILPAWIIASISLFLYSFTQVDLSLTFSRASIFQTIEKSFQYVGWFNRPLSALLYILIISILFALYTLTLNLIRKKYIDRKKVFGIVLVVSAILFFSYNAFSYDLFNYIFDAKIITHYHENPYIHKALDYSTDPMLSFMRWTHRVYPYGPAWLLVTVPLSFIGFNVFILTFYLYKALMFASFIGSVFLIEKIAKKSGRDVAFSVAAFALNPLVLIESLVSAHNDIVMMFFGLLGLYLYLEKKYVNSFIWTLFSILVKFATGLMLVPILLNKFFKLDKEKFFYVLILSMIIGVILATVRTQFQPWYLLFILPFSAFVSEKYFVIIPTLIISIFSLLQYLPYIYLGDWNPPVPFILSTLTLLSIAISLVVILLYRIFWANTGRRRK